MGYTTLLLSLQLFMGHYAEMEAGNGGKGKGKEVRVT